MYKKSQTKSSFWKKITTFFSEIIYDWFKYSLTFLLSILVLVIAYIISWAFIGGIIDENILQHIRQNINNTETNYQIENVNFRWLWDESILILAYEKLNNYIDGWFEEDNQDTYPWMYVFSKADNQLNITKLIYWDKYYKNELYFEILPSKWSEYFSTWTFDNMRFNLINKLKFWNQEIILFSITQEGFSFSNTSRYFWFLRYNFNSWKVEIQPILSKFNTVSFLDSQDSLYLKSECLKIHTESPEINCSDIFDIDTFSKIRASLNNKEEEVRLTFDTQIWWYWKIYISDDGNHMKNITSLNWYTWRDCNQCEQDLLISSYEFSKWDYKFQDVLLIRKNDKDFWKKLDAQFMDYKSLE